MYVHSKITIFTKTKTTSFWSYILKQRRFELDLEFFKKSLRCTKTTLFWPHMPDFQDFSSFNPIAAMFHLQKKKNP